jgi:hypothetical protein
MYQRFHRVNSRKLFYGETNQGPSGVSIEEIPRGLVKYSFLRTQFYKKRNVI